MTDRTSVLQNVNTGKNISTLPHSNTGVLNTSDIITPPKTPLNSITLDYIRFTLPYLTANFISLSDFVTGPGERQKTGMNGYTHRSAVLKTGHVLWSPDRHEMGIHVVLPASALSAIELTPIGLINWVLDKDGHFTRIDIAFDDFTGGLDIAEMDRKLRSGEVVTRWRTAKTQNGSYDVGQGIDNGNGVTIGSRSSNSYCRIYDKKMEREAKEKPVDLDSWVRVEIEIKGKKAQELARILGKTATIGSAGNILKNLLYGLLDFKDPGKDSNKSRWATCEWWLDFIGATEKLKLSLPKEERTLDDIKEWWDKFVSPMTAVILLAETEEGEIDGYNWLMDSIARGEMKLKGHHKRLIMLNGQA